MALLANLSAEDNWLFTESRLAEVAVAEGCVVVEGTANGNCKLPAGALASRAVGVSTSAGTSDGSTEKITIGVLGRGKVLLGATLTVAAGDELVISNASGHVRKRVAGDASGAVIGRALVGRTAGAAAEFISAFIQLSEIVGL